VRDVTATVHGFSTASALGLRGAKRRLKLKVSTPTGSYESRVSDDIKVIAKLYAFDEEIVRFDKRFIGGSQMIEPKHGRECVKCAQAPRRP
jgi:hypothetical protein